MTIKEGALAKAWDYNPNDYVIGVYYGEGTPTFPFEIVFDGNMHEQYKNAIEIPSELAKQLEELGND